MTPHSLPELTGECAADFLKIDVQVYTRLQERLGLKDHAMVLNVMLSKIATNLKVYGSCDDIITQTLNLFQVWHQHALYNTPCPTFLQWSFKSETSPCSPPCV